jgi:hypothetical protein
MIHGSPEVHDGAKSNDVGLTILFDPLHHPLHLFDWFITVLLHVLEELASKALQLVGAVLPEQLAFREVGKESYLISSGLFVIPSFNALGLLHGSANHPFGYVVELV